MRQIVLLTDFGNKDGYVGAMKGVILKINPKASFVDLAHDSDSFDVDSAAFVLWNHARYFPKGTIFLAVVDPGVGASRRAIAIKTNNYFFIGPDNGVLAAAAQQDGVVKVIELTNKKYYLPLVSKTFHGRDVFAPLAAYLSKGVAFEKLGKKIDYFKQTDIRAFVVDDDGVVQARIVYIDKFGNLITNISKDDLLRFFPAGKVKCVLRGKSFNLLCNSYVQGKTTPFLVEGSCGFLEISLKNKSAKDYFSVKCIHQDILSVYAANETEVTRLHSQYPKYEKFVSGEKDYFIPLKDVKINIVSSVESNSIIKGGRLNSVKLSGSEQKRFKALLSKFLEVYIPYHAGVNTAKKGPYELVIICDPVVGVDVDENSKRLSEIPSPDNTGLKVDLKHFLYPIVTGWYYLVNTEKNTVIFSNKMSGTGSVIDTAMDDFALSLALDFGEKIK
jgi:S-adenosylmethionine hydrolase